MPLLGEPLVSLENGSLKNFFLECVAKMYRNNGVLGFWLPSNTENIYYNITLVTSKMKRVRVLDDGEGDTEKNKK